MPPNKCYLWSLGVLEWELEWVLEWALVWVLVWVLAQELANSICGSHVPTSLLWEMTDRKLCTHPS